MQRMTCTRTASTCSVICNTASPSEGNIVLMTNREG